MQAKNLLSQKIPYLSLYLKKRGIKQKEMADFLKVNLITFNRWATGQRPIKPVYISKIAEYLKITPEDLLLQNLASNKPLNIDNDDVVAWRERALLAEAKLSHLQLACNTLRKQISTIENAVDNFSKIISE